MVIDHLQVLGPDPPSTLDRACDHFRSHLRYSQPEYWMQIPFEPGIAWKKPRR